MIDVQFTKVDERAIEPRNAYGNDAGWDLFALEDTIVPCTPILTWVRTGIAVALPDGFYGRIVGRSSAVTKGYLVMEGTIDAGYRGEQMGRVFPLWIHKEENDAGVFRPRNRLIKAGESICQLIVQEVKPVRFIEVATLPDSARGTNGYGSSGA